MALSGLALNVVSMLLMASTLRILAAIEFIAEVELRSIFEDAQPLPKMLTF